jgi:hypothetical protein
MLINIIESASETHTFVLHGENAGLDRYLAEFDFRYNKRSGLGIEDGERAAEALNLRFAATNGCETFQ